MHVNAVKCHSKGMQMHHMHINDYSCTLMHPEQNAKRSNAHDFVENEVKCTSMHTNALGHKSHAFRAQTTLIPCGLSAWPVAMHCHALCTECM